MNRLVFNDLCNLTRSLVEEDASAFASSSSSPLPCIFSFCVFDHLSLCKIVVTSMGIPIISYIVN